MEDTSLTHALVEAARSLDDPWTVGDTLETIVTAGGASGPGFEHVGNLGGPRRGQDGEPGRH